MKSAVSTTVRTLAPTKSAVVPPKDAAWKENGNLRNSQTTLSHIRCAKEKHLRFGSPKQAEKVLSRSKDPK